MYEMAVVQLYGPCHGHNHMSDETSIRPRQHVTAVAVDRIAVGKVGFAGSTATSVH